MFSILIKYLQAKLAALPYIDQSLGLGLQIQSGGDKVMAVYSAGELQLINFDTLQTLVYLVQNGEVIRETIENTWVACAYYIKETYRLKIVLYSNGSEDMNCESYSQQMAEGLKSYIVGQQPQLTEATGADNVNIVVTGTDLLKSSVWASQFSLPNALKDTDVLIAINFNVVIQGDEQCFTGEPCSPGNFTFDFSKINTLKATAFIHRYTAHGISTYDFTELYGDNVKIDFVQLDNMPLTPAQYSKINASNGGINYGRLTITDTTFPISDSQYLNIAYHVE